MERQARLDRFDRTSRTMPEGLDDEYGVLYLSGPPGDVHAVRFLCPCGDPDCLHVLPVNGHTDGVGKASWGFEEHDDGTVTLTPSILRHAHQYPPNKEFPEGHTVGCGSHFFIRRNRVDWC